MMPNLKLQYLTSLEMLHLCQKVVKMGSLQIIGLEWWNESLTQRRSNVTDSCDNDPFALPPPLAAYQTRLRECVN